MNQIIQFQKKNPLQASLTRPNSLPTAKLELMKQKLKVDTGALEPATSIPCT